MILFLLACQPTPPVIDLDSPGNTPGRDSAPLTGDSDPPIETLPGDSEITQTIPEETTVPDVVVDCNGAGDYLTISAAIAASAGGTHIGVLPCEYAEDLDFGGKSLDIFGIEGSSKTTLRGNGRGPAVIVAHGESVGTRLAGLTVTGGDAGAWGYGSGLYIDTAILEVEDVVFTANNGGNSVLYAHGASLEFQNVVFSDNEVTREGMHLYVDNGSLLAEGLTLTCDDGPYGLYTHNSTILLDSTIKCGESYGVVVDGGEIHVRRSRIESEGVALYGEDNEDTRNERFWLHHSAFVGGDTAVAVSYMHIKADHNVFWAERNGLQMNLVHAESYVTNSVAVGGLCGIRSDGYAYLFGWNATGDDGGSCGVAGFGTVAGDPLFVGAPLNFNPSEESPLVDAGDPGEEDKDDTRCDIGMYGGNPGASGI